MEVLRAAAAVWIFCLSVGHAQELDEDAQRGALENVRNVPPGGHPAWLADVLVHEINPGNGQEVERRPITGERVVTVHDGIEASAEPW